MSTPVPTMPPQRRSARNSPLEAIPVRTTDWSGLLSPVILTALAIAAYSGSFGVPLLFDDIPAIADNPSIRHWHSVLLPPIDTTAGGRPVLNLSLALNYACSGTVVWSYHLTNLAIHVLAGLTLLGILRRTFARWAGVPSMLVAFFAALLWTLHPLQTESVTYIVQRAEALMGLFYLLTLYWFIRGAEAEALSRGRWFALAVGACLLGMATKEVMVSAPVIVLFYDRTFLAGTFREAWRLRWRVYACLGGTWLILLALAFSTHGRGGSAGLDSVDSYWSYVLTQFPAILRYLKLSVWPHPLVFYYGTEWVTDYWAILPSVVFVVGLVTATVWCLVRPGLVGKSLGFAGVWFFAVLAPTSLIPINRQTAAEHRMYLALIPLVVLAVVTVYQRLDRWARPFCVIVAAGLLGLTLQRNHDYRSALNLWADTVAKSPGNAFAHYNLGHALEKEPGRLEEAIGQYREALRLNPDIIEARTNLGGALNAQGRTQEALIELETARQLAPNSAAAHNNLGVALNKAVGRRKDAIAEFQAALRLKPDFADAHANLGNALKAEGRTMEAIAQHKEALRLNPGSAEVHYNLANALVTLPGRQNEAIAEYETALQLKPDYAEAHHNLGGALVAAGRTREGISRFEEAVYLKPDYVEAHINLGIALFADGRTLAAITELEAALRLAPDSAPAHLGLGNALTVAGRFPEAISQYEEALRLRPEQANAHYNLANALGKLPDRSGEAIAQYKKALHLQPDFLEAHFNLAVVLLKTGGPADEAKAHLEAVLRIQPENDAARQILAAIRTARP